MKPNKGVVLTSISLLMFTVTLAVTWELGTSVVNYRSVSNPNNLLNRDSAYTTLGYLFARTSSDCPPGFHVKTDGAVCENNDASGGYLRGWEIIDFGSNEFTYDIRMQVSDFDISCYWQYCDQLGYPYIIMFYSEDGTHWKSLGGSGALDDKTYAIETKAINNSMRYLLLGRHGGGSARPDPVIHYVERSTELEDEPEPQGEIKLIIETPFLNTSVSPEAVFTMAVPQGSPITYLYRAFDPDFEAVESNPMGPIDYNGTTYTPYVFMPEKIGKYIILGAFMDEGSFVDIQFGVIEVVQ
jgi:hypothetical protein